MIRALTNKELVQQYIDDVLSGERIAGKLERDAVLRHLDDIKNARNRGFVFNEAAADRACNFFPMITHTTGSYDGKPFELKPFQRFIIWVLFGWVNAESGFRRFTRAIIELARGNGKSPFAAALLLLCFAYDCPVESRAECYTAATKKKQAKIVFDEVKRFVSKNKAMQSRIRSLSSRLEVPDNHSSLEPLGQDSQNTDGLVPHFISVDELHAWQDRHRELWDKLETAMGKRDQPLMVIITTYGSDESELWEEMHELAVDIVDRDTPTEMDDHFVFICAVDEGDDPFDEQCWHKANPMLREGVVKISHLRSMATKARLDPKHLNRFERYHLNRKVTATTRLFPAKLWKLGNADLPDLEGRDCHGGFDWGWKDDLAALALVFPLDTVEVTYVDDDGSEYNSQKRRFATLVDAWIPEDCARDLTRDPWRTWIDNGYLRVTSGNTTDTAAIYGRIGVLSQKYNIRTIALDGNNCRELGSRVEPEFGIEPFVFGQTHGKYNEPTRELADALRQDRFVHGCNPLLAWTAKNVASSEDGRGYVKPDKKRSKDKIDPMCAVIMGLSECMFAESEGPSIYETEGTLFE